MKDLARTLTVSNDGVNIGVVTFSYYARLTIRLSDYKDTQSFLQGTNRIQHMNSQTFIDRALLVARTLLFTEENGDRKDAPNILILLTDGKQTKSVFARSPLAEADLLRKSGVTILAVGIGTSVDEIELAAIGGSPDNLILSTSFDELLAGPALSTIMNIVCTSAASK